MLLFFGWGVLVAQPIALNFGRRGVILISLLCTVVCDFILHIYLFTRALDTDPPPSPGAFF